METLERRTRCAASQVTPQLLRRSTSLQVLLLMSTKDNFRYRVIRSVLAVSHPTNLFTICCTGSTALLC